MPVQPRYVPARIVSLPPGHYKHWHRHEMREARRDEKAQRKYWKAQAKAERHNGHGGPGHGRGHD